MNQHNSVTNSFFISFLSYPPPSFWSLPGRSRTFHVGCRSWSAYWWAASFATFSFRCFKSTCSLIQASLTPSLSYPAVRALGMHPHFIDALQISYCFVALQYFAWLCEYVAPISTPLPFHLAKEYLLMAKRHKTILDRQFDWIQHLWSWGSSSADENGTYLHQSQQE